MDEKRSWRCIDCGWITESEERPEVCQNCGDNANFEHGEPFAEEDSMLKDEGMD